MRYSFLSKYRSELMGLAMLFVMAFHMTVLQLPYSVDYLRSLGFGGVDIFILLSGMGLAMSLLRRNQPFGEYLGRRALRVLPAYYLVMVPYTAVLMTLGRARLSTMFWNATLLYYWENPTGKFNWYLAGIMVFYVAAPFLVRLMRRFRRREVPALMIVAFGVALTMLLVFDNDFIHQDLSYRIPIFGVGLLMGFYIHEEKPFRLPDGICWSVILVLGLIYRRIYQSFGIYLPLCFLFLFTTVPLCLAVSWLFETLRLPRLRTVLRTIGEASLEIYLLNVTLFVEHGFLMGRFDPGPGHYLYAAGNLALNLVLGIGFHRLMQTSMVQGFLSKWRAWFGGATAEAVPSSLRSQEADPETPIR